MSTASTRAQVASRHARSLRQLACVAGLVLSLAACVANPLRPTTGPTPVKYAPTEIPEQELLNVGIEIFDTGELSRKEIEQRGMSQDIREAEARFIAVHLKDTMQRTGHWGAG